MAIQLVFMRAIRLVLWIGFGLATMSVVAQFTLHLGPVFPATPGQAEITFTREPGYYYCLESSPDLDGTFTQASAWIVGDGLPKTWPLTYPISPATGGGGQVTPTTTFSLYPFAENGKTLVSWRDASDTRYSAIVTRNYTTPPNILPPTLIVPENGPAPGLFLLVGRIAWIDDYGDLLETLLPAAQQTVLSQFTTRHTDILAAIAGSPGAGVVAETEKQFYRIRRVEADADGDGIDWATETFLLGTNADDEDTDGDGYDDAAEIANGTNPTDFFDGLAPVITIVDGDGQLAWVNQFDELPLIVRVDKPNGRNVANHKVVFSATFAGLGANKAPTAPLSATFETVTNATGYAFVFFRQPNASRVTTTIHAQTQGKTVSATASVDFSTYAVGGNKNLPAAPQNLNGHWVPGTTSELVAYELTWEDHSNNEIDFVIEKSLNGTSHWIPIGIAPANATSWRDRDFDLTEDVYYQVTSMGP